MATQKTEAIITLNGKQALDVLSMLQERARKVAEEMQKWDPDTKDFKKLKEEYDLLASAQVKDIETTKRLSSAIENLSSTSLKNLRRALGDGKRQLEGLSEAELKHAETIRAQMREIGNQIRLLEGQYVKIREGLASIATQSDQWLNKAVAQQNDLLNTTRRGTKEYKEQEQILTILTAEQNRRAAAVRAEAEAQRAARFKGQVADSRKMLSSPDLTQYSQSQIESSISTLKQAQRQLTTMGSEDWKQYAEEIRRAEDELDKLTGKFKEVKEAMPKRDAEFILNNMGDYSEKQIREAIDTIKTLRDQTKVGSSEWRAYALTVEDAEDELAKLTGRAKEVKEAMSTSELDNRMQSLSSQTEQSLKEMLARLNELKSGLVPFTDEWKQVADQIGRVKDRMDELKTNTPYAQTTGAAIGIAWGDKYQADDGTERDVTRKDLQWAKGKLQHELDVTPVADVNKMEVIRDSLAHIDERMKALDGSTEQAAMSSERLEEVLGNIETSSLEDLTSASSELKRQLNGLAPSSEAAKKVRKQIQLLDREIKQTGDDMVDVNDVIRRSKEGRASIDELKKAYKQLQTELEHIETSGKAFKDKQKEMQNLRKRIDSVTGAANKQAEAWQTALRNLTAYGGLFKAFGMLQDTVTSAIRKNFEYSSSLMDIRKVSGLAEGDIRKLSEELAKIDTRTSVDQLAQLAYQGAKLGMGKYGVEGMRQFVAAADQINVAIGEEMGEEALPALSKMVETMGLIPKMGIEKAMLATGSALFKLSSTSTATSSNIVEFAKRLTGVSRTAGITTSQLLALGSASDSLFLMPEVSATAMSKFIVALQKNHNIIEKDLGIQQGTIANLYAAGRAMDAVVLVLDKMHDKGNMNALGDIFKDVGSDGQRLITTMVTMAKNVDLLKDHLYESEEAFEEASAVTNEYTMQQQSAMGILERANNLWEKAFVNSDGVNSVKTLAETWYDMSHIMLESPILSGALHAALSSVLVAARALAALLPLFINIALSQGIISAARAIWDMAKAIRAAKTAQELLNIACLKNPYLAVASAVLTAIGVIYGYVNAANEAAEAQAEATRKANEWRNNIGEARVETEKMRMTLQGYKQRLEMANTSQREKQKIIGRFNSEFRQYITNLGIEINSVDDLRKHYKELADEVQRSVFYRAREKSMQEAMAPHIAEQVDAGRKVREALALIPGSAAIKSKDIIEMIRNGKSIGQVLTYVQNNLVKSSGKKSYFNGHVEVDETEAGKRSDEIIKTSTLNNLRGKLQYLVNSIKRGNRARHKVNEDFDPIVPQGYTPYTEDSPGTLSNYAEDPDAKAAALRQRKEWRDTLKEKKDEANAIMANVRNFYERQINAKKEQMVTQGKDESEQQFFIDPIQKRMNAALEQVRLALAGEKNTWKEFKKTMNADLVEMAKDGVNPSENLLNQIDNVDVDALRNTIQKLAGTLNIPRNAILSEIFLKATQDSGSTLDMLLSQQQERDKAAMEHDYTGTVQQSFYDKFNTLGYANPTDAEMANTKEGEAAAKKRKDNIRSMFEAARTNISKVFDMDVSKEEDRSALMQLLFGDDPDKFAKRIEDILGDSGKEWQTFYLKLIQYNDEYESAQKKADDERKKLTDYKWDKSDTHKSFESEIAAKKQYSEIFSDDRSIGQNMGFSSIVETDPVVALYKARLEAAKAYYEHLEAHGATEEHLAEARKALMESQSTYAKKLAEDFNAQTNNLLSFMQPLQSFGEAVGDAFATMTDNAKEGRKALKTALKQMIKSFATNSLQMISQQQIDRYQTQAHYQQLLAIQQAYGTAQVSAEVANGQAMTAAQAVNQEQQETQEGVHQTNQAALKSVGIFGWCIDTLGPIAGPIVYSAMMATLMGLLNFALSKIGGSNSSSTSNAKPNGKVISGMLTYDSGNVQDLRPYVADNGEIYWAKEEHRRPEGVSLLTTPTATTINGQPSLVAERGPELVIGRETTQAMMMNNPQLLRALVSYDRHYSGRKAHDSGNISSLVPSFTAQPNDALLAANTATNEALTEAVNALLSRLKEPINAQINMFGRNQLYDRLDQANRFMKGKS